MSAQRRLPLEGVRVVDFTWVAAGPSAAMILALQGADVIRVEALGRVDLAVASDNPNGHADHAPVYQALNLAKRNILLNLKEPAGRDVGRRLALKADVVLESMRPGRLASLGIDYDDLRRDRPDLVMASLSGFGQSGPEAFYAGYAPVFAASGGMSHLTGYPDGIPTQFRGSADMRSGLTLLVAVLSALRRARKHGVGAYIDVSAVEASACVAGEAIVDIQMTGRDPGRVGNDHPVMAPHGVYETAEADSYLTIACRDDADWRALCRVLPQLSVPRFARARERWLHRGEVDEALRPLIRARKRSALAAALQAEGVPAVASMSNKDVFEDAHAHERGVWAKVDHPVQGERWVIGIPWTSSRYGRGAEPKPAPLQGQYTREILADELGFGSDEIDALIAKGVVYAAD